LIDQLAAGETALEQLLGALEFLIGQQLFALAQLHVGLGGGEVFPGAQHFGFGLGALGFQGAGVHARQQLALGDLVAFIDQHFGQAPGILLAICTSVAPGGRCPCSSLRAAVLVDFQ
jgi:hypothetical protein